MKSTKTILIVALVIGMVVLAPALAGDLEPPGPPAPTMVTLKDIHDLIVRQGGSVAKTGQTSCWAYGSAISCWGTGQDGEYQYGVSLSPRFTDNGDGTVKDNLTGLVWLKNANCFGLRNWTNALTDANMLHHGACGLTDGSVNGNWRLPNVRELHSLIDFAQVSPALLPGHPFSGVQGSGYWSSTTFVYEPFAAWIAWLDYGAVGTDDKSLSNFVWPVRGGR